MSDSAPSPPGSDQAPVPAEHQLQRRPALHYTLEPEGDNWLTTALRNMSPGLTFLTTRYQRDWLARDTIAGVAVATYLVPQVMAYSAIVGVPAVTALWTALVSLLVYVVVGGSRVLSVGPESTIALLAGLSVAPLAHGDPQRVIVLTAALSIIVGIWCLLGRVLRLGVVADLLSQPLLVGYLGGAAVLMVVGQLGKLTGTEVSGESIVDQVSSFVEVATMSHPVTLAVSGGTLAIILLIQWIRPSWPGVLIGVAAAMVAHAVGNLSAYGVKVVGEVPGGLPRIAVPAVTPEELKVLIVAGLGVAVMAYSDNMLVARAFPAPRLPGERPSESEVDPQGEMAALGTVHLAVGAIGGFPVSSSGSRTALALASRARTQMYSLAAAVVVILVLSVAGRITALLPEAALGAVVVYAASKLVSFGDFARLLRFRRRELLLALITLVGTVVYGILAGVGLAVALSLLEMGQRLARPHSAVLGRVPGLAGMHDVSDYPNAETLPGLVIYRYDAPLFFANVSDFRGHVQRIVEEESAAYPHEPLRWFLVNVEAVTEVDITAADGLRALHDDLAEQGVRLGLVRIKRELFEPLQRSGVTDAIGEDMLFPTLPVAEHAYLQWAAEHPMQAPEPPPVPGAPDPGSLMHLWTKDGSMGEAPGPLGGLGNGPTVSAPQPTDAAEPPAAPKLADGAEPETPTLDDGAETTLADGAEPEAPTLPGPRRERAPDEV